MDGSKIDSVMNQKIFFGNWDESIIDVNQAFNSVAIQVYTSTDRLPFF